MAVKRRVVPTAQVKRKSPTPSFNVGQKLTAAEIAYLKALEKYQEQIGGAGGQTLGVKLKITWTPGHVLTAADVKAIDSFLKLPTKGAPNPTNIDPLSALNNVNTFFANPMGSIGASVHKWWTGQKGSTIVEIVIAGVALIVLIGSAHSLAGGGGISIPKPSPVPTAKDIVKGVEGTLKPAPSNAKQVSSIDLTGKSASARGSKGKFIPMSEVP